MDCFGAYFTHLLPTPRPSGMCTHGRCDAIFTSIRRPHKGRWTTWLNLRHTNARAPSCDMVDAAECSMQIQNFDMRQRNAKSCESTDASNAQTCDKVRVQSGTQWCASVIHLPKCVVTIVFKRLRHGVVRSILYICPNHATPCCNLFLIHAFILCHSWFVFDVH